MYSRVDPPTYNAGPWKHSPTPFGPTIATRVSVSTLNRRSWQQATEAAQAPTGVFIVSSTTYLSLTPHTGTSGTPFRTGALNQHLRSSDPSIPKRNEGKFTVFSDPALHTSRKSLHSSV